MAWLPCRVTGQTPVFDTPQKSASLTSRDLNSLSGDRWRDLSRQRKEMMMTRRIVAVLTTFTMATFAFAGPSQAARRTPTTSVTWTGNGTYVDGSGSRLLSHSVCGMENGAPVDGNYLVFTLASTKNISAVTIAYGISAPVPMSKSNPGKRGVGSWNHTLVGSYDLHDMYADGVTALYSGMGTPVLSLSEGCQEVPSLTFRFLGELASPTTYGALGSQSAISPTIRICQDLAATNCISFTNGSAVDSVQKLVLTGSTPCPVYVTITPTSGGEAVYFHPAAVTASNAASDPLIFDHYIGNITGTQSNSPPWNSGGYSNGDTVYIHATFTAP